MQVLDVMTKDVHLISSEANVEEAAIKMRDFKIGILPIEENDKMIGMITDRDLVLQVLATGRDAIKTTVKEVMSEKVRYCFEDENIEDVAYSMGILGHHRLPVVNRQKKLVGIISLSDIARNETTDSPATQAIKTMSA